VGRKERKSFSNAALKNSYSYLLYKVRGCGNVFKDYICIKLQYITESNVTSVTDVCKRNSWTKETTTLQKPLSSQEANIPHSKKNSEKNDIPAYKIASTFQYFP